MLPGLDGSGDLFEPLRGPLEAHFDIVACRYPDLPGFDDYVDYAASLLPAERPVSLLAESFSGPVAIALLARQLRRIEAAVLSATFAVPPHPLLMRLAGLRPAAGFTHPVLRRLAIELFGLNGCEHAETRALVFEVTARSDPAVLLRRIAILRQVDVRELLPAIDNPVLCLRGRRDRVVPAHHGGMLTAGLANARLVEIDAPHLLLQCRPRQCAELIVGHLTARNG